MNNPNTKIYLAISGALIFLFILIIIIPFSKKTPTQDNPSNPTDQVFPTSVEINPTASSGEQMDSIPADFTGAIEESIPQQIVDMAAQKKDLQGKVPIDLSSFIIDFDYDQDKFIVTLKDPKDQAQKEFDSWRITNYSGLSSEQFLLK